jgi:hypothetical protein
VTREITQYDKDNNITRDEHHDHTIRTTPLMQQEEQHKVGRTLKSHDKSSSTNITTTTTPTQLDQQHQHDKKNNTT